VESGRAKLIEGLFSEASAYIEKGDAVQSSEKLYKAAEECIKALAEHFNLEEVKAAEDKGRWTVTLLEKAVGKLVEKLGMDVEIAWAEANYLTHGASMKRNSTYKMLKNESQPLENS